MASKFKIPHTFTIVFFIVVACAILTCGEKQVFDIFLGQRVGLSGPRRCLDNQ